MNIYNIEVCQDCLLFIANGDLPNDSTEQEDKNFMASIQAQWPTEKYQLCADGDELGFCQYSCECCCSPLGGQRYRVNVIERKTKEEIEKEVLENAIESLKIRSFQPETRQEPRKTAIISIVYKGFRWKLGRYAAAQKIKEHRAVGFKVKKINNEYLISVN